MALLATDNRPETKLEREVIAWTDSVYEEAEQELNQTHELKLTGKLIDYIHGRQWSPQARFGRSRPVSNRLFRQFIEQVGLLTDIEPDFQVKFFDKKEGFSELEKLLNDMIGMWAVMNDFEMELSQTVIYGLLHTGYGKVQWNPAKGNGEGDNQFIPVSPINMMLVGTQSNLQDAECVIYRQPATMAHLLRKFGTVARGVRPEMGISGTPAQTMRPAKMSMGTWSRLTPQLRNLLGQRQEGTSSKYPVALMKEFWLRDDSINESSRSFRVGPEAANWSYIVEPGMPLYPRGRIIVTAGGKVLEDTCNPYWHGLFPFGQYRPFRVPWQLNGLSPLEPIAAIQNILNRLNGGIMDTVKAAIEPTLIGPKAAFSESGWDALDPGEPGGKIKYNNNSPRAPEFRKPPELASYVLAYKQDLEKEQDATSGSAAIQQALGKKQVPGGDSLDMIMSSRSTNIRLMGRGLKSFLTEIGTMTAANFLQFSTAKSRAARFGGAGLMDSDFAPLYGNLKPHSMKPEEFVRLCTFSIRKGSLLSIEKSDEIQAAFGLRKMKDLSRRGLYRKLDANIDVEQIEKELMTEAMQMMGLQAMAAASAGKGAGGGHGHGKK